MKLTRKIILLGLMLAIGPEAFAQSNDVPGPSDYQAFSRFIARRNIFDPNREPHYTSTYRRPTRRVINASAPYLSLVGIMSYNKGTFAFFNANDPDLKQVLTVSGKIAGYTLTSLSQREATLVSDDKTNQITLNLKVGDVLRQENGKWMKSDVTDVPEQQPAATPAES